MFMVWISVLPSQFQQTCSNANSHLDLVIVRLWVLELDIKFDYSGSHRITDQYVSKE